MKLIYKKKRNKILCIVIAWLAATMALTLPVQASVGASGERVYTIRIYAGNAGIFSNNSIDFFKQQGITAAVTDTYVEMQLAAGSDLPVVPKNSDGCITFSSENSGKYYVLDDAAQGACTFTKNQGVVTRSENITLQYGRLLDGVEYTVKYIEQGTGTEVALPKTIYENAGMEITEKAIDIVGYTLASSDTQTIKLAKNTVNTIIFEYIRNGGDTIYTEISSTEYIDGGTTTEYVETEVPTYVVTASAGADRGVGAVGEGAPDGAAEGAENVGAAGEAEGEAGIEIPDRGIPLDEKPAGMTEQEETEDHNIEEGKVPLAAGDMMPMWAWIAGIVGAFVIITIGAIIIVRVRLKKINLKK